jgi:hypothetical protein
LYLLRASGVWLWGVQVNYLQIRHLDRIDELIMNRKTEYFNWVFKNGHKMGVIPIVRVIITRGFHQQRRVSPSSPSG